VTRICRARVLRYAGVLAAYTLLTVTLTWPLPATIDSALAGESTDVYINPWADWWTRKALVEELDLYHTDYILYPNGTSLIFHSFSHVTTALSLLLSLVSSRFVAYNLAILLAYPLSAYGMFLLARHLTGSTPASFIAGLVYAFHPYHMYESAHPDIVSTQWIPLFVLALFRITQRGPGKPARLALLAALWFVLTALSSWHLMVMLIGFILVYLLYGLLLARSEWRANAWRWLLVAGLVASLSIAPLLLPIVFEHVTTDTEYMAVSLDEGLGNDLLTFFVPNQRHPLLGPLVESINQQIGYAQKRPGYLGYSCLAVALLGATKARRKTRFWVLLGLIVFVVSLGPQITWGGTPLHDFHLPWARPIIELQRHAFRLNVLLFLAFAVLVGFGAQKACDWAKSRHAWLAALTIAGVTGCITFEYLVRPFPTTQPYCSPYLALIAEEEGEFAVADVPMGRLEAKYYMYCQMTHGKKIVDGHVSRTPSDAYAFVDAHPLLGPLRARVIPSPELDIGEQLSSLSAQGIRYLILHRHFFRYDEMGVWSAWIQALPTPLYGDDWVLVYGTQAPRADPFPPDRQPVDVQLGDHIWLAEFQVTSVETSPGEALNVALFWRSDGTASEDLHVFVHLLSQDGLLVAQHDGVPAYWTRPVATWLPSEVVRDDHMLFIDQGLPPGAYTLTVGMYEGLTVERLPALMQDGTRLPEDRIVLGEVEVVSR